MVQKVKEFIQRHQRYAPVTFFMGGFIWDSLTLGRIDTLYSNFVLCTYLIMLSICLYLFNLADDGKWKNTLLEKYEAYFPLAIQFFLGGLSSAYVIFYSRSVSLTKTMSFFIILVVLLFANEFLKHRISNKYLQFGAYFFVNFTFFTFFIPVLTNLMNTFVFVFSGLVSLATSLFLVHYIYKKSPSTREEVHLGKIVGLVMGIYILINTFYYFNLIPPVPLALENGIVARQIEKIDNRFEVSYERGSWFKFWNTYDPTFSYQEGDSVMIFTSIFGPADLRKSVYHRWEWFSPNTGEWEVTDRIGYEITGGRDGGYRGYTYKKQLMAGDWEVDVITEEGLVLGSIGFRIVERAATPDQLVRTVF